MNPQEINMLLSKITCDLDYIFKSRAWQQILDLSHAHPDMEIDLGNAMHHATRLKLHVRQALDANLDIELDQLFEEAA